MADEVDLDVVIVGAGFCGLYALWRLRGDGFRARVFDAAPGHGGVWHWNAYPGARVDSHWPNYEFSMESVWRDWKPAEELLSPQVWDRFSQGLAAGLDPTMVRASLVPSDLLMRALGRPNREQIVSMRPDNITTLEAIDLANGELLAGLLKKGAGKLSKAGLPSERLVDSVFMQALGRHPTPQEKAGLASTMGEKPSAQSIEDLLWLVLLLPEFQFVR